MASTLKKKLRSPRFFTGKSFYSKRMTWLSENKLAPAIIMLST